MNGAREYADLFETGQYGGLRIVTGEHARGSYFHIYVKPEGAPREVEVYGIRGGHPGWTEYYGWIYRGPWESDFAALCETARKKIAERKAQVAIEDADRKRKDEAEVASALAMYKPGGAE